MARKQLRTSNYSPEARTRLGEAVEAARIAGGYRYRTDFCRANNIKNLRGLELLEQGQTGVGQAFLFQIADALPGWNRDTPRVILEGGSPPEAAPAQSDEAAPDDEWTEEDERLYDALDALVRPHGLRLTPKIVQAMRDAWEQERSQSEQANTD